MSKRCKPPRKGEEEQASQSSLEIQILDPTSQVFDHFITGNTGPLVDFLKRKKLLSDLLAYLEKTAGDFATYRSAVPAYIPTENADYDKMFFLYLWRIGVAVCDMLQAGYERSPEAFRAFMRPENAMPTLYRLPFTKANLDLLRKQAKAIGLGEKLKLKDHSKTQFKTSHGVNYPKIALDVYHNLMRRYSFDLPSREKFKGWKGKIPVATRDPSGKVTITRRKTKLLCQLPTLSLHTLKEWRDVLEAEFLKTRPTEQYWKDLQATCKRKDKSDYNREEYRERFYLDHCMQALRGLLAKK